MKYFSLIFFCIIIAASGFASERSEYLSKTGRVLICPNNQTKKMQLLDLYEARKQYHLNVDVPRAKTPFEAALKVIEKLKPLRESRYELYKGMMQLYHLDPKNGGVRWTDHIELRGVNADTVYPPKGCHQKAVSQIVMEALPDGKNITLKILVDRPFFMSLDYEDQVGVLLHIILAIEGTGYSIIEDPAGTRVFTAMLLSKEFNRFDEDSFDDFLSSIDYYSYLDTFLPPPGVW